jgi:hypothetical protein
MRIYFIVIPIVAAMSGCGDGVRHSGSSGSRGALSSALSKSKDSSGDRSVEGRAGYYPSECVINHEAHSDNVVNANYNAGIANNEDLLPSIGMTSYYIYVNDSYFNSITGVGLDCKLQDTRRNISFDIFFAGEIYDLNAKSDLSLGVKDMFGICGGLNGRYYFNSSKVFLSPFVGGGFSVGRAYWTYRNTLIDDNGDKISGDSLDFYQVEVFSGFDLWRKSGLSFCGQIGGVIRIYDFNTGQDFKNDILWGNFGIKGNVTIGYNF